MPFHLLALLASAGGAPEDLPDEDARTVVVTAARAADQAGRTAAKTDTDARDIPAAVVVIPREVLEQQDVRTLDAALENASAVAPNFAGGYGVADNYLVRGLPVRFLRDGLPDGPSFMGYRRTLADIASVEVLKGPGSALYGRAEAGGSVNLSTLQPEARPALAAEASYGRFDARAATLDATAPLGSAFSARAIANYEATDGYRGLSRRLVDVLPTLAASLGDHRLTLDYDRREQRSRVDNYGLPFTTARRLADVDRRSRFYSPFNRVEQDIDRVALSDQWQATPALQLRAAGVIDDRRLDVARNAGGNPVNAAGVMTGRNGRTQSDRGRYRTGQVEAVISATGGALASVTLVGAEYASIDVRTVRRNYLLPNVTIANGTARAPETALPTVTTPGFDRRITSETLSAYAQQQLDLADTFKLRVGARYDGLRLVDDGTVGTTRRRIAGAPGLWSWQAGAVYAPTAHVSLYGGYARGAFVSIQTESVSLTPVPERSTQWEAGLKAEPIPGLLNVDLAAFRTTRDRYFVTLVPGGDPVQVGRQRSKGVELDLIGTPAPGLTVIGNAACVDAVNRSDALASLAGVAVNQSVRGRRIGSTPRWSGALWANYAPPAVPGLSVGAGVTFKGAVFVDSLELLRLPSQAVVRAALGYRVGPVEARVTVDNLLGERWYAVPTFIGALPGEPRSVRVTLRTAV